MSVTFRMFMKPCPTGSTVGKNPFLVQPQILSSLGKSYFAGVENLRNKYGNAPRVTLVDYRMLTFPLKSLTVEHLVDLSGASPDDMEAVQPYLFSLRDSFVSMMKRIMEKYPTEWNERVPSSFEEREIYDSVTGIMEDDELDDLNAALGGSPVLIDRVMKVHSKLFENLETKVVKTGFWQRSDLSGSQASKHANGALILLPGATGPSSSLVIEKALRNAPQRDSSQQSIWSWYNVSSEMERIVGKYIGS